MTQEKAGYRRAPNKTKKRRCETCIFFREHQLTASTHSCVKVGGQIRVDHVCTNWEGRGAR